MSEFSKESDLPSPALPECSPMNPDRRSIRSVFCPPTSPVSFVAVLSVFLLPVAVPHRLWCPGGRMDSLLTENKKMRRNGQGRKTTRMQRVGDSPHWKGMKMTSNLRIAKVPHRRR